MGGTMRLGADPIKLHDSTAIRELYGEAVVYERHRHRYEVNNHLRRRLESAGLICSGTSPDERLVEVIELPRTSIRSLSPRSTTRSSSRAPCVPRRCSARSWAPRSPRSEPRRGRPRRRRAVTCQQAAGVVRRRHRGGAPAARRDVRVTVPDREPDGRERACADWVAAELDGIGVGVEEDGAGGIVGSDAGNLLARHPRRRGAASDPAVRASRHGAADSAGRAGDRRRRLGERRTRGSSAPTTRRRSR